MLSLGIRNLEMRFPGLETPALAIGSFSLPAGGRLAVTGASGSGKSTLVNAITGLERVGSGGVHWNETDIAALPSGRRDAFRARHIGLVMQDFHLFPGLSAFENVVLPWHLARRLTRPDAARPTLGHIFRDQAPRGRLDRDVAKVGGVLGEAARDRAT